MTDATLAAGDLSSAENFSSDINLLPLDAAEAVSTELAEPVIDDTPNGFIALGLAPELILAVKDLGFTQPTIVQNKTIPLAMQGLSDDGKGARFVDLMVSSQTGSGKTAAFLLPVLHTCSNSKKLPKPNPVPTTSKLWQKLPPKANLPPSAPSAKIRPTRVISAHPHPAP